MDDRVPSAVAELASKVEAARARGLAVADPVAFAVIEALARKAALQHGAVRQAMLVRIDALLSQCRTGSPSTPDPQAVMATGALAGLSRLVDRLGRMTATASAPGQRSKPEPLSRRPAPQPLKAVVAFHGTWSRLRVEHRLRQALAQVPAGAGPLNSSHIVNRALETMRDVSPAYLDAFMTHIDTLQWLEQASGAGDLAPRPAGSSDGRKRAPPRIGRKG